MKLQETLKGLICEIASLDSIMMLLKIDMLLLSTMMVMSQVVED
jgi:hypothetical protein